ncbi:MAG: hypothetical protein A2V74_11875 [Acidobacteria bacterium RBG_16_70_10]|nr:MAG: hypothetical protein A2V74_11875 [Acidobacteria bacterium RBG_16_70_10]
MRSISISALGLAFAAVVLGVCASAPAEGGSRAETDCINRREINAISALDDEHVFVKLSASRFYLLTVAKGCNGLRLARAIAIEGSRTRVCGNGLSLLSFDEPAVGPTRCRVEQIESVKDKGAALDLIESRAARE